MRMRCYHASYYSQDSGVKGHRGGPFVDYTFRKLSGAFNTTIYARGAVGEYVVGEVYEDLPFFPTEESPAQD
jgi:hypothetical protein